MSGEMNQPVIVKCTECETPLTDQMRSHVDENTPDHYGLCCDCFDVINGMAPKPKLGVKSVANWFDYTEYD